MHLNRRRHRFDKRIDSLTGLFHRHEKHTKCTQGVYLVERALIQLQIEFELFVRSVILDSATGRFYNSSGNVSSKLTAKLPTRDHASRFIIKKFNRNREPDWYLPNVAIQAATHLQLTNLSDISIHLGVTPWTIDDLRFVRNFIAHRSKHSAESIRKAQIVPKQGQIDPIALAYSYSATGKRNYEDWTDFVKLIARLLVQ